MRNTRPSHNDANSGARPLRGISLTNDHQDPSTSPPRRPPIHGGKGPRPERNHWDSSYVGELREYYGPVQMHTLAPTRTKKDTEAHINRREHGPRRGKIPLTQSGAAKFRRRAGKRPPRSPRVKTSGNSTVVTQQWPRGLTPVYTWGAKTPQAATAVKSRGFAKRGERRRIAPNSDLWRIDWVYNLASVGCTRVHRLGRSLRSGEHIDAEWMWFLQLSAYRLTHTRNSTGSNKKNVSTLGKTCRG